MAVCEACASGNHLGCEPVPDPDVEMRFTDCTCCCDPEHVQRQEHARILINEAKAALAAGRDQFCVDALRRALDLLGKPLRKPPPLRRLAIVAKPSSYAQLSGESLPEWMARKHGDGR